MHNQIQRFRQSVYICRTSNLPDYVDFDKYLDTNLPFVCCYDIPNRINSDKTIDAQGKRLLDLCISTGLLIANGRLHADKNAGKFTFSSHRGESTVDYLLLELDDFSTLCDFEVLDFTEFSDHAAVTFCMLCNKEISKISDNTHSQSTNNRKKINWDKSKDEVFASKIRQKTDDLRSLEEALNSENNFSIDSAVDMFSKLLIDESDKLFERP